jgi:hypothetical protein
MMNERKLLGQTKSAASTVSKASKQTRKAKAKAVANAIQPSLAGNKAAATLNAKKRTAVKKQQDSYQMNQAKATARIGGRRKQLHTGSRGK